MIRTITEEVSLVCGRERRCEVDGDLAFGLYEHPDV